MDIITFTILNNMEALRTPDITIERYFVYQTDCGFIMNMNLSDTWTKPTLYWMACQLRDFPETTEITKACRL